MNANGTAQRTVTVIHPESYPTIIEKATTNMMSHLERVEKQYGALYPNEGTMLEVYKGAALTHFQLLTMLILSNGLNSQELITAIRRIHGNLVGNLTHAGEHGHLATRAAEIAITNVVIKALEG